MRTWIDADAEPVYELATKPAANQSQHHGDKRAHQTGGTWHVSI